MMIRLLVGLLACLLLLEANGAVPADVQERITKLQAHDVQVKTHPRSGKVQLIGAKPQNPLMVPAVNEVMRADVAGMGAIEYFGPMFGLARPGQEMRPISETSTARGGSSHRYRQFHRGVPVLAGELKVNLDKYRRVISMSGETGSDLDVDVRPGIKRQQARKLALRAMKKWYQVSRRSLRADVPELWVVDPKMLKPGDREARLAWRVEVTDRQKPHSIREVLFIDARTAGVILHINLIERAKNRATYTANSTNSLPGTLVCDESDPDCLAGDSEAQNAHLFAGQTYDFFFNEHGRDSLDDAGQTLVSTVHYSDFLCPNAFWNGEQMVYCTGLVTDDIVGHELTHGITENTSNLLYYYQSGAINESLSDIWGEFVDLTNSSGDDSPSARWLIGEDLSGTIGVIRNMADPPAMGDPDRMSSPYYWYSAGDNGGVHFNSGINNKAAYLMTDGGNFNGYTVNGLGIGKVADIYYEAQTNLLTSGSDYADLHSALGQACQNLIGIDGITAGDCLDVQAAIDAVEMDTDPEGFNPDAPVCIGGDPPDDLFFDDFESGTGQWNLVNVAGSSTPAWIHDFGYASSGTFMLWGRDSLPSTDGTAEMNIDVPLPLAQKPYLHFKHSFSFETSFDLDTLDLAYWDGGFVDYSTDGGATWSDAGPLIESGQDYNAIIYDNPANPNANHPAFGSESHGYVSTRFDLSILAGQNVRFRWHTSTDLFAQGAFGWVIDDVRVYTCANEPPVPAIVEFSNAAYVIGEAGPEAIITVDRTGGNSIAFSIDYATSGINALAGVDFGAVSGTLNFANGENSRTFSVPIVDDADIEGNELVRLTLGNGSDAVPGAVSEATLTITDNDSTDFAWVDDGLPDGAIIGASTWTWVSTDPLPYSGTQAHQSELASGFHQHYFYGVSPPLQVQVGDILYAYVYLDPDNPPREIMLTWNAGVVGNADWHHRAYWGEDLIDKGVNGTPSRQYMGPLPPTGQWVRLEVPASAVGLEGAAVTGMSFNLFDGRATWDTAGITTTSTSSEAAEVEFSDAAYVVGEAGPAAIISVNRTGGSSNAFTIDYATSDDTALAGADYAAVNGTLSFAGGENSQTFSVPIFEDILVEGDEFVTLSLSGGSGAIPGTVSAATLTIADNDSSDFVWVDDALPDGATARASANGAWNWVAANPAPYSGTLAHQSTLAAGLHQHYFFGVTTPLAIQAGDILYTWVYLDPVNPPRELMLTWNAGVVGANDWHHRAYWGEDLIDKGVNGTPSRQYMGPLPPTAQWVRLDVPASAVGLEGAEITGMSFNLYDGRATWDKAGIISPTAGPTLAEVEFSDTAYEVGEAGLQAIITVNRSGGSSSAFTIDYATGGGTALAGVDYAAVSGTLNFADGENSQTFSVPVYEDVVVEGSETVLLTLSGGSGAIPGAAAQATLSITDNDSTDFVWMDDALPDGASAGASPTGAWNWIAAGPTPYSGALAHQSALSAGFHQHYFYGVTTPVQVLTGDVLYTFVYLDPVNPPRELMLTWNAGVVGNNDWHHRAYWGEDLIDKGVNGTPSRQYMGPLPATGQWVRLDVPAAAVGLEGTEITGMSFNLFDGRATWDLAGKLSPTSP